VTLLWDNLCMTLREQTDEFSLRLGRIGATERTMRELSTCIHETGSPAALVTVLERLDRDLVLARHDLERLRERAGEDVRSAVAG
jgi:hypothetical protein